MTDLSVVPDEAGVPASHAVAIERLRGAVYRGENAAMIDLPGAPVYVLEVGTGGCFVALSVWSVPGITVRIRGPYPGDDLAHLPGDLEVQFTKTARVDLEVWDQGDAAIWWRPPALELGESPWYTLADS